jgi:hypothetical protein
MYTVEEFDALIWKDNAFISVLDIAILMRLYILVKNIKVNADLVKFRSIKYYKTGVFSIIEILRPSIVYNI